MSFDVNGKTALVTGANRGIGRAIVSSLIEHDAGKIYAAVRDLRSAAPLVDAYGAKIVPLHVDLSEPSTIVEAAATATDVELVINNAGVLRTCNAIADDAIETLQFEMEVNVHGLIRMARAFAPVLKKNGGGVFVQLNSVASMKCFADFATYSASKAAAYSITQGLRETLAANGTKVMSVHPGPIATEMASKAGLDEDAEPPEVVSEAIIEGLADGVFHVFPDKMAKQIAGVYRHFAEYVIEAKLS